MKFSESETATEGCYTNSPGIAKRSSNRSGPGFLYQLQLTGNIPRLGISVQVGLEKLGGVVSTASRESAVCNSE